MEESKDPLDRFFHRESIKSKMNPMEKKKLLELDKKGDALWKTCSELEKQRDKLRKELIPDNREELLELKIARNKLLQEKTEEVRQIKEDRKEIWREFREKTGYIRKARKEQLNSNPELAKNKKEKDRLWKKHGEIRNKFHDYYKHLTKKYAEEQQEVSK